MSTNNINNNSKSLESWIWSAACSIRGAKDAPKFKDYILPLVFAKRLCDVFDDEVNRIAGEVGSRSKAFQLVKADKKLVRFYLPLVPEDPEDDVWSVIRKFAEGGGQSAGEFYTPMEVGRIMAMVLAPEPGMEVYDPTCGSGGLLIKCELYLDEQMKAVGNDSYPPLKLYGQEYTPETWAMANMNMIIHDMEGEIEIGDTFKNPKFRDRGRLRTFDRVIANPMWNQKEYAEKDYDADELDRFPEGAGFPGRSSADWGWVQHMHASLNATGRAAVVLDTGAVSRGSGNAGTNKEKTVRQWFVDNDLIESVLYLPENLFYNTSAPGIVLFLNKNKPKAQQGKVFLVNASQIFEKGDPKNFIPVEGIKHIADTLINWKEEEKLSRIVDHSELKKNDYNISPSRYIHTADAETYRPIAEIVAELDAIEAEAQETDKALREILEKIGVGV